MITVRDLQVYKVRTRRGRQQHEVPVVSWAIAGPDGAVLCYAAQYPSSDLLDDAVFALNGGIDGPH